MPITSSAKKALRQSVRRKTRNIKRKTRIKRLLKEVRSLVKEKKQKDASALLPSVYKALDKGAKTGVIKKRAADRKKSRIAALLNVPVS